MVQSSQVPGPVRELAARLAAPQPMEAVKILSEAGVRFPAMPPFCGCYRPRLRLIMATTFD